MYVSISLRSFINWVVDAKKKSRENGFSMAGRLFIEEKNDRVDIVRITLETLGTVKLDVTQATQSIFA